MFCADWSVCPCYISGFVGADKRVISGDFSQYLFTTCNVDVNVFASIE